MGGGCSGAILPSTFISSHSHSHPPSTTPTHIPLEIRSCRSTDQYEILTTIGKGGYARVYCARNQYSKSLLALKKISFNRREIQQCEIDMAIAELNAYKMAGDSRFITTIYEAFYESGYCYLFLDYHAGGDLRYHSKSLLLTHESHIAYYISCIGSALKHLHQKGIIHRDVKPENILLTSTGIPKLADFGTAYIEEVLPIPICQLSSGTLPYMAPEMLTRNKIHSYQCDYWSLGVVAYELLFNRRPFDKHCPKRYMYFVGNQYNYLWEKIRNQLSNIKDQSYCSSDIDFLVVDNSIMESEREEYRPFPDHLFPLQEDGTVQPDLLIPLPQQTYSGNLLSSECLNFLQSTLDIRVPHRLGQLSRYELFSHHPWFQKHNCVVTSELSLLASPYQPSLALVEHYIKTKFPPDSHIQESNKVVPCDEIVPEDVEILLQKSYHYNPNQRESVKVSSNPSKKSFTSPFITTHDEESFPKLVATAAAEVECT